MSSLKSNKRVEIILVENKKGHIQTLFSKSEHEFLHFGQDINIILYIICIHYRKQFFIEHELRGKMVGKR